MKFFQYHTLTIISSTLKTICLLLIIPLSTLGAEPHLKIVIKSNIPGGNVIVDSVRGTNVYIRPDLRDTRTEWFYWYFAVITSAPTTLNFHLTRPNCLTNQGPAVSSDYGKTWRWSDNKTSDNSFTLPMPAGKPVHVSMAMPYLESNWKRFINPYTLHPNVVLETLCVTPKGRNVEKLIISPPDPASITQKILITARHHSCEMMANYVLEGIIMQLFSNSQDMRDLLATTEFWIIPFMDKDGVEEGDQGKNRAPRDHNRDYDGKSVHASTSALRELAKEWDEKQLKIAIDIHCPWIKGDLNEHIYLVGHPDKKIARAQEDFADRLESNNSGEVKFHKEKGILPYGTSWNTDKNTKDGKSFANWAGDFSNIDLATSLEIPYALNDGVLLTPTNLKVFGKEIAAALK